MQGFYLWKWMGYKLEERCIFGAYRLDSRLGHHVFSLYSALHCTNTYCSCFVSVVMLQSFSRFLRGGAAFER